MSRELKVNRCGGCPFFDFNEQFDSMICIHPKHINEDGSAVKMD